MECNNTLKRLLICNDKKKIRYIINNSLPLLIKEPNKVVTLLNYFSLIQFQKYLMLISIFY